MKGNSSIIILACCIGLLSCTKDQRLMFTDKQSVYFHTDSLMYQQDSMTFSFAVKPGSITEDTIAIPLKITGVAGNKPRSFNVIAVDSLSTAQAGKHYAIIAPAFKGGGVNDSLYIKIFKTADLLTSEVRLGLRIVAGGELEPGPEEKLRYLVKINNILSKPDNWDQLVVGFFGPYSQAKHRFIIDVTGLAAYDFRLPGTTRIDNQYYEYLKQVLREALAERGPVNDETGNPISFPL